jgi:dynein light chain roadblock-type
VICNKAGTVLRRFPQMSQELAEQYAEQVKHLALKARSVIRDLEPTNELQYLRIRAKKHEVMVAYGACAAFVLAFLVGLIFPR